MTVIYKGLDCVADADTAEYKRLYAISQSGKLAWAYQAEYAKWCLYFGAVLIGLAVFRKIFYMYSDWTYRNTKLGQKSYNLSIISKAAAVSRSITYRRTPLIISRITGLPPTVGTLITLALSTIFILCVCFIPHYYFRPCRGFGSPPLAVRAGMMSMALTPFLIVVSGKTNFISHVTGVSYEKLNVFHQALGWGSFFLAMVHTVPFLMQDVAEGGMDRLRMKWNMELIYRNGVPPLVFLFLLCFLSTRFSRGLFYEVWFHSHWLFGIAYIGTLTWHIYGSLKSEEYIWGTFGFWGFQLLYRAVVKTTLKPNQYAFKSKEVKLKMMPGDVFEVSVPIANDYELDWNPGQHIFIRFLYGMHTLDNHPFSILTTSQANKKTTLKLIVKPQRGLTKKLYSLLEDDKSVKDMRCFIDGPYGGMNRDPLAFDKLVLVSTGTGVSVTAPFLSHVAERIHTVTNCVQKVEFIWVIKTLEAIEWINDELTSALEKAGRDELSGAFDIKIFVTNSVDGKQPRVVSSKSQLLTLDLPTTESESKESVENVNLDIDISSHIRVYENVKPDLKNYLQETELCTKTAVICSGTGSAQEACGNAVAALQKKVLSDTDVEEVYLHTENFGW